MEGKLFLGIVLVCFLLTFVEGKWVSLEPDQDLQYWKQDGWKQLGRVKSTKLLHLTFAIKQRNVHKLERTLAEVSDPDSVFYGNYLTIEQITRMVSPSKVALKTLKQWLKMYDVTDCESTQNKDFLSCSIRCDVAEKLLIGTVFFYFVHPKTGTMVIRSPSRYYVPEHVARHLDFIVGLHRFPAVNWRKHLPSEENSSKYKINLQQNVKNSNGIQNQNIHVGVYPSVLRKRYNISSNVGSHPNNSQAVAQFLEQYYSATDLKEFMAMFGRSFTHMDKIAKVVGPDTGRSGIEASLDTQYIMSTGANISTWFWSTAGRHETQEPFLTWLMAIGNMTEVPYVHSVSYGDVESSLSTIYMQRVSVEFMKAGTRGISILFASGDNGAGCKNEKFSPNFPASSPYVTAVGGTAFSNPFTTSGEYGYEISGGGFSNVFAQPSYQKESVANYLNNKEISIPPEKYFNKSGRAYPDISAVSNHFWVVNNLVPVPGVAGTSASTPTVAGIFSLVNDARLKAKLPVMGFLNPFIYKNAKLLYDVTSGYNEGCLARDRGFNAAKGWDPVTGNGTPNFAELVKRANEIAKQVYMAF
eukprot:gene7198-8004_t